jgi:hypothetical protein
VRLNYTADTHLARPNAPIPAARELGCRKESEWFLSLFADASQTEIALSPEVLNSHDSALVFLCAHAKHTFVLARRLFILLSQRADLQCESDASERKLEEMFAELSLCLCLPFEQFSPTGWLRNFNDGIEI